MADVPKPDQEVKVTGAFGGDELVDLSEINAGSSRARGLFLLGHAEADSCEKFSHISRLE